MSRQKHRYDLNEYDDFAKNDIENETLVYLVSASELNPNHDAENDRLHH